MSVTDNRPSYMMTPAATPAPRKNRKSGRKLGFSIFKNVAAAVIAIVSAFPVYWMVQSSFLTTNQIRGATPTFFPIGGTLNNYVKVITDPDSTNFLSALKWSALVTLVTLIFGLLFGFLAALAATRFRFFGRRSFIVTILIIQMIPGEAMMISILAILGSWNLTNSVLGLGLVYIASVLPFTIWTLRGFVAGVPAELEESAQIDGCTKFGAFFRVTFPLMAPGLISTGVFAFIQAWNEFIMALVIMNKPEYYTLPIWMRFFMDAKKGVDWGMVMAGSVLMTIPVIVFFLLVQGRMTGGLVSGAVKG